MFHALKNVNLAKNRSLDLVPLSVKRVLLPMKPGVEGSDYINATYLHVSILSPQPRLMGNKSDLNRCFIMIFLSSYFLINLNNEDLKETKLEIKGPVLISLA